MSCRSVTDVTVAPPARGYMAPPPQPRENPSAKGPLTLVFARWETGSDLFRTGRRMKTRQDASLLSEQTRPVGLQVVASVQVDKLQQRFHVRAACCVALWRNTTRSHVFPKHQLRVSDSKSSQIYC